MEPSTVARALGERYSDFEREPERLRLDPQWQELLEGEDLIVLDEAQAWPPVFVRLRGAIDARRQRAGRGLLLGPVSPSLMTQVAEPLAGRLALVELTPLLVRELPQPARTTRHWLCGGFPEGGVLDPTRFPH